MVVSNPNVSQDTPKVNTHYTQESENYSSPEQDNDGNSYSFGDTHSGENLYDTPDYLKPQSEREWSAFARSFANKTNDLKNGEQRNIIIYTADNIYFVTADGYMSGTIVLKESFYANEEYISKVQEEFTNGTFVRTESDDKLIEGIRSNRGRNYRRHASFKEILALEENEGLDGNSYIGNDERSDTSSYNYTHRNEAGLDNSAFSMPENDDEVSYSFEDDVVDKTSSLAERVRLGEISQTEYLNELRQLMDEATEKYGAIEKGENPKVDVTVPKQVSDKRNTRRKNNKKES